MGKKEKQQKTAAPTIEQIEQQWFEAYQELGGPHDRATFDRNVKTFHRLTKEAFIFGHGDRNQAWARWRKAIGSQAEAVRYFDAIDSVTPYS